jgi:hypothetical protein
MKKHFILACVVVFSGLVSCGKTENPETVRQIRNTVSDSIRMYGDMYGNSTWLTDHFYAIFFADLDSYPELEKLIEGKKLEFKTMDGIKIYKEVARKDLRYIKESDSYVVRNDFVVIAVYNNDSLEILDKPSISMQYYRLKKDPKDNNKYKIIETLPSIDSCKLISRDAFIRNYTEYTQNEEIKKKVESIK